MLRRCGGRWAVPAGLLLLGAVLCGPARAACDIRDVARLPLLSRAGHVFTSARIEGVETSLLVDTGAAVSALDRSVATRLRLKESPARDTAIIGINGRIERSLRTLSVARLDLGPLSLPGAAMVRSDLNRGRPPDMRIEGILGADILSQYDVEFDPAKDSLVLHTVKGCAGAFLDWPTAPLAVSLQPFSGDRLKTAAVTVDDHPLAALVDTGATQSVLFDAAVRKLGKTLRRDPADRTGFGLGATGGRRVDVRLHRFGALRIGEERIADPVLAIARSNPLDLDMVLGLDVLAKRRFWLSYATNQLFLAPP